MGKIKIVSFIALMSLSIIACQAFTGLSTPKPTPTSLPTETPVPTPLPPIPVIPGEENPEEPVFITGDITYTSPFFINLISEPFVLLEDQAGFVDRDEEFLFPLDGQAIGPVEIHEDNTLTYSLALPAIPQGTQLDLDNNGQDDNGVQVFGIAFWSNTWGGPFLEERDGSGWSNAYASTLTDPENDNEIIGGKLIVWSPDDQQSFPTGFGDDGMLFTQDDPTAPIPAGYNLVDLNQEPFIIHKETRPKIDLHEGEIEVKDYSEMEYLDAFTNLFDKVSREYPFTEEKNIDWSSLYEQYAPQIEQAGEAKDFYNLLRDFTNEIPDAHVGISFDAEIFFEENGGSYGMVISELSDGRVIVSDILPDTPADSNSIEIGAEIITWNGAPISQAIDEVIPAFGPYSTDHHRRLEQLVFLTRNPPGGEATIEYQNPGSSSSETVTMDAEIEYGSLFAAIPTFQEDELVLPVEGEIIDGTGIGYVRISTFSDDHSLMAGLWEHYIQGLIDNETPGLIIDVRTNGGGSSNIAMDYVGYFFDEEITLYQGNYFNENSGEFEPDGLPTKIKPGPAHFDGLIVVIVSPYCVSACEGFTYAMTQNERATVIGHFPTAGAFGEVGRGQYQLPEDISAQFPTGRPETLDGELLIEGTGVIPDIIVPVSEESALGVDTLMEEAIEYILEQLDE